MPATKEVEMLFAHMKRILKLDRLRLRAMSGAHDEFLLTATVQNLRRMVKLLGQPPPGSRRSYYHLSDTEYFNSIGHEPAVRCKLLLVQNVLIVSKNSVSVRNVNISASMRSFILADMRAHMKLLIHRQRASHSLSKENFIALQENMY